MRILVDFRSYQISWNRGIGRYILALTESLAQVSDIDVSVLISQNLHPVNFSKNIQPKINIYILENFSRYIIEKNFDFFIKGNFFDTPFCSDKTMYPPQVLQRCNDVAGILYDLIPLVYAGNYNNPIAQSYAKNLELMKYASHFFCISKQTMNDGIKYLNRPRNDFTNIYGSTDEQKFRGINSDKPYHANNRLHNIIFTSGGDRRKNYAGAAQAFARAYETGHIPKDSKLYLICAINDTFKKDVERAIAGYKAKIGKQIIVTGYISDAELGDLLTTATASIFPSFYEGLGLPILESYIAGTPCFASNLSSTKELVMKEASFDPYNQEEMSNLIIRIFNDEELCQKSLAWGRKLLKKINWHNSAKIMANKLKELQTRFSDSEQQKNHKIAVFTILPPMTSGIAPYSYNTHIVEPQKYDIFSNIQNLNNYIALQKKQTNNVFPIGFYNYADFKEKYKAEIFVFGNSYHHKEILDYAIQTKGKSKNRFMYLHEAFLVFLFLPMFHNDLNQMRSFLITWYPEKQKEISKLANIDIKALLDMHIYGLRPLINLTGIKHIFVNTQKAKQLIEEELTEQELKELTVDMFFLPLYKIKAKKLALRKNRKQKVIGTFGIPTPFKQSDEIYKAVKLLNETGHDIKLIFAGYNCSNMKNRESEDFVEIYNSPSDDELYALMNSIDLAIQLRQNSLGESSGCISQLLSLGQNILTSEGFVSDDLAQYCHTVPEKIEVKELSTKILKALTKPKYNLRKLIAQYSYQKLSQQLEKSVERYIKEDREINDE